MLINKEIDILNTNDFHKGVEIIEKHWNKQYGNIQMQEKNSKCVLELITGGWSENENLINLLRNTGFWILWWQESRRGGYYKFIYLGKSKKKIELKKENTIAIQSIEEITIRPYQGFSNIVNYLEEKGNEIIKALKQLDNKINKSYCEIEIL